MKTSIVTASIFICLIAISCKRKTYVCECTDKKTGGKSYGDKFKGELQRRSAQVACDDLANKLDTTSTCKLITQ